VTIFDIPQPDAEIAARIDRDEREFLSTFGETPLSRSYLNTLVTEDRNIDTIEVMDIINKARNPDRFEKYNEEGYADLTEDEETKITGIVFHTMGDDMWYGAYFFEKLEAWAYTVYGEDKGEVQNSHALYVSGIKQQKSMADSTREDILDLDQDNS